MSKPIKETLQQGFQTVESSATKNNLAIILDTLDVNKGTIKITETLVETMGASGISMKNACSLLHKKFNWLTENPTMLAAFERGRANLGSKVRGTLVEAALENNNIQSAIYLDKILTGDTVASEVNLTVSTSQLSTVSDDDLLAVAFEVEDTVVDEYHAEQTETHSGEKDSNGETLSGTVDNTVNLTLGAGGGSTPAV